MKTTYEIREANFGWFIMKNGKNFDKHPPLKSTALSAYKLAREDAEQNRPAEIITFEEGMQEKEELPKKTLG